MESRRKMHRKSGTGFYPDSGPRLAVLATHRSQLGFGKPLAQGIWSWFCFYFWWSLSSSLQGFSLSIDCMGRIFQEGDHIAVYLQKPQLERPAWRPHSMVLARGVAVWETDAVMHRERAQLLSGPPLQTQTDGGNGFAEEQKHSS